MNLTEHNKAREKPEALTKKIHKLEMMVLVILAFWLLLPFSGSAVEANQYCSAQPSKDPFAPLFMPFRRSEFEVNVIRHAKRFYYADLNFELGRLRAIAEYMKNMIYPVTVKIPGRDDFLVVLNVNITTECKYVGNGSKCTFWNETLQKDSEFCKDLPECSNTSTSNCSELTTDEIGFCRENVSSLIRKVTAIGTFTMTERYNADLKNKSSDAYQDLNNKLLAPLANSFSNLKGFQCVKILQFRRGSIIVEFELNINGELSSEDFLRQAKDAISLIGSEVNSSSLKLKVDGLLKIEVYPEVINYKDHINVLCTIKDKVDESEWFIRAPREKEDALIARRRYVLDKGDQRSVSKLSVEATAIWKDDLIFGDLKHSSQEVRKTLYKCFRTNNIYGKYTCSMSAYNRSIVHEIQREAQFYLLPDEIIVTPSSYTPDTQQKANEVQCCIKQDYETYNVTLESGTSACASESNFPITKHVGTSNNQTCWNFTINCTVQETLICKFTNCANVSTNGHFSVNFLKKSKIQCPLDLNENYTWPITPADSNAESNLTCEEGSVGKIIRVCDEKGHWQKVFRNCTSAELLKLWDISKEIKEGRGDVTKVVPHVLDSLNCTLKAKGITIADSQASVKILDLVSQAVDNAASVVSFTEVSTFLSIASSLIEQKIRTTEETQIHNSDSSRLMMSIETFATAMNSTEQDRNQSFPQIQLQAEEFEANSTDDYFANFSGDSTATLNVTGWRNISNDSAVIISSLLFLDMDRVLPPPEENQIVNSHILTSTISSKFNRANRINPHITLTLSPIVKPANLSSARCVFWDYTVIKNKQIGWSTKGCKTEMIDNNIRCTCNHLTSFAVLMSPLDKTIPFIEELTYIGLSISIMSLLICITIEKITWKTVTTSSIAYSRHITQLNTAVALLVAQISFLIGSIEYIKKADHLCTVATIFTHFFFLSTFFWTLNQSLTLLHQIIFVFHHIGRSTFISSCFVIGYGCPLAIVIAATTSFLKKGIYKREDSCWLNATMNHKFSAFLTFIIPVGCIVAINIIILTIVILKLLRPNISEGFKEREKETIKKIMKAVLIFTPTFGLTWIVGFAQLKDESHYLSYAFVLLNSLQGLFILLAAGFTEKKIREALVNRFKPMVSRTTSENVQTKHSFQSFTK